MSRHSRRILITFVLLAWATTAFAQPAQVVPADLDTFVQRVMQAFEVPGVSLAIVKDDPYDPYVTRELTIRDLLVHRSGLGLGAGDLLWWPSSTYDRKEIARRLRYIEPATSFRSAYAYDNVLTNQESGETFNAIAYGVADAYTGEPRSRWLEGFQKIRARNDAATALAEKKTAASRNADFSFDFQDLLLRPIK